MDDLLGYITGFVGICLIPEPYYPIDDVSNKSSEEEDSDEMIIVLCDIRKRTSSVIASKQTLYSSLIALL